MDSTELFEWRSCGLTTVGTVRKHNEDSYLALPNKQLWVVADGMGGHARGDLASQSVIEAYRDFESRRTLAQTIDDLEDRAINVNQRLRKEIGDNIKNMMGSTIVMMYAKRHYAFFLWAGDSRIYRYRKKHLEQISHDHSFVQESVDKGVMTPEEAMKHPSSNIITRAVGVHDDIQMDIDYTTVEHGDKFLLCSDGLFKDIAMNEISNELEKIPMRAAEGLIDLALSRGANDNVTVIVIEALDKKQMTG